MQKNQRASKFFICSGLIAVVILFFLFTTLAPKDHDFGVPSIPPKAPLFISIPPKAPLYAASGALWLRMGKERGRGNSSIFRLNAKTGQFDFHNNVSRVVLDIGTNDSPSYVEKWRKDVVYIALEPQPDAFRKMDRIVRKMQGPCGPKGRCIVINAAAGASRSFTSPRTVCVPPC